MNFVILKITSSRSTKSTQSTTIFFFTSKVQTIFSYIEALFTASKDKKKDGQKKRIITFRDFFFYDN